MKTCYACTEIAENDEHVPPRCIFPHKKYLPKGVIDLRKNLITVPSCKLHNNDKKLDDEYLGCFLATAADNNLALHYFSEKWIKHLQKNDNSLMNRFFHKSRPIVLKNGESTITLSVDRCRIAESLKYICKGLYYHENRYERKLLGDRWGFSSPNLLNEDLSTPEEFGEPIKLRTLFTEANRENFIGFSIKGNNQDVFYYQKIEIPDKIVFRLVFYFHLEFYMIYHCT